MKTQPLTIDKKLAEIFPLNGLFHGALNEKKIYNIFFNISEEDYNYINMMERVMEKTERIFKTFFSKSKKISILFSFYSSKKLKEGEISPQFQKLVEECQFEMKRNDQYQFKETKHENGYIHYYHTEKDANYEIFKPIIWARGGSELGIKPTANLKAYFFDLENELLFELYDVRGLFIASKKRENLLECKEKFSQWINRSNL